MIAAGVALVVRLRPERVQIVGATKEALRNGALRLSPEDIRPDDSRPLDAGTERRLRSLGHIL